MVEKTNIATAVDSNRQNQVESHFDLIPASVHSNIVIPIFLSFMFSRQYGQPSDPAILGQSKATMPWSRQYDV
jgi:hypothetical protein